MCLRALESESGPSPAGAVAWWREAARLRADSDYAYAHLADSLLRLGRSDEAREACEKALRLDASNELARKVQAGLGGGSR